VLIGRHSFKFEAALAMTPPLLKALFPYAHFRKSESYCPPDDDGG
jgi:hypothetical protein